MIKRTKVSVLHCKKCDSVVWSRHVHDFRSCKCGTCFIDGGGEYTRYGGDLDQAEIHEIEIPKNLDKFSFKRFGKLSMKLNKKRKWPNPQWIDKDIVPRLASLHSEVSEAYEAFKHQDFYNFVEELADIIVRTYDLSSSINKKYDYALEYLILELYVKTQANLLRKYKYKQDRNL